MLCCIKKCLTKTVDFLCRKWSGFTNSTNADEEVTLDENVIENVTKFSYLGDALSFEEA